MNTYPQVEQTSPKMVDFEELLNQMSISREQRTNLMNRLERCATRLKSGYSNGLEAPMPEREDTVLNALKWEAEVADRTNGWLEGLVRHLETLV